MMTKFQPGAHAVIADFDQWLKNDGLLPLTGVVDHTEVMQNVDGERQEWVYLWLDYSPQQREHRGYDEHLVRFRAEEVALIPMMRYGVLLKDLPAISCPWCLEHGRDARITAYPYYVHPALEDCQCWHHHHNEHMADCPFGAPNADKE